MRKKHWNGILFLMLLSVFAYLSISIAVAVGAPVKEPLGPSPLDLYSSQPTDDSFVNAPQILKQPDAGTAMDRWNIKCNS